LFCLSVYNCFVVVVVLVGCWLNSDGTTFIPPPNSKPPKNVVGWDARKGEWVYALPKRRKTTHRGAPFNIHLPPPKVVSSSKSITTSSTSSPQDIEKSTNKRTPKKTKPNSSPSLTVTHHYLLHTNLPTFYPMPPPVPWKKTKTRIHFDLPQHLLHRHSDILLRVPRHSRTALLLSPLPSSRPTRRILTPPPFTLF
jgi:hypothetical protein